MISNFHHFICAHCGRVLSIDRRVPAEVIRTEFAVLGLQRERIDGRFKFIEHPLVCGDECHAAANRHGLPGWSIAPGNQKDDDVEVIVLD